MKGAFDARDRLKKRPIEVFNYPKERAVGVSNPSEVSLPRLHYSRLRREFFLGSTLPVIWLEGRKKEAKER